MRTWTIVAGVLASTALVSGKAEAANCAALSFSAPTTVSGWNPLNNGTGTATFTATATRDANGVRSARILLLDNDTGVTKIGAAGPQYEILDASNNVISAQSGTAVPTLNTIVQFTWGSGGSDNDGPRTFLVRVLPSSSTDWVSGTNYSEALKYSIQCFGSSGSTMGSATNLAATTVSLTIPSLLSLTTASPQTINFGSFTTATQHVDVGLKSTSSVNVSIATTNVNQMVLAGAVTPYPANSVIPYTMTLNGDPIASGGSLSNRTRAGVAGTSWPLVLNLTGGLPSGKLAGGYSDTITLTLTPGT